MHHFENEIPRMYDLMNLETGAMLTRNHRMTESEATQKNYALRLNSSRLKYVPQSNSVERD
jgi:hypothetical protein